MHRAAVIAVSVVMTGACSGAVICRFSQHPVLPRASCGQVTIGPAGSAGPASPLTCFSTAARECKTASIGVTWPSVDTGSSAVFTIEPGGKPCRVSELGQGYGYVGGNLQSGPVSATPCQVAAVNSKGVMLHCGGQAVIIPAAVTTWWAAAVSAAGRIGWETRLPLNGNAPDSVTPVAAGAVAVFAQDGSVYGLRLADGLRLWSWRDGPLVDELWSWHDLAVVLTFTASSHAMLTGLTAETGHVRWSLDLGTGQPGGLSATPDGGLAPVTFSGVPEVVNLADGKLRWAGPRSPSALTTAAGVAIVVSAGQAAGYDERTGRAAWTVSGLPFQAQAQLADGLVIVTSGLYGGGEPTAMTAIVPGSGRVAWRFDPGSWLLLDGAGPAGLLVSDDLAPHQLYLLNPVTGRPRWQMTTAVPGGGAAVVTTTDAVILEGNYPYRIVDRSAADGRIRWLQPVTGFTKPTVTGSVVLLPDMPGAGTLLRAYRLGSGRLAWQAHMPACLLSPLASLPSGTLVQTSGQGCAQPGGG